MKMTSDQNLSHPVNCELLFLLPSHRSLSLIPSMDSDSIFSNLKLIPLPN
ncbi:hypothetical protein YC2023_116547 [Brassica napus]